MDANENSHAQVSYDKGNEGGALSMDVKSEIISLHENFANQLVSFASYTPLGEVSCASYRSLPFYGM